MRLLAVDASTWWGGAALLDVYEGAPRLVADAGVHVEDSHAARLLPLVEGLLASAGWIKDSLDAYAATRGPGSFTGVRVGLGLVSGFALATSRPIAVFTIFRLIVKAALMFSLKTRASRTRVTISSDAHTS